MARKAPDLKIKAVIGGKDELTPTLRRLKTQARSAFRGIARAGKTAGLGIAAAGAAATLAGRAIYRFASDQAKDADKISKGARATGFATEEYSRLAFVADRAGVNQEAFAKSMRSFSVAVGEAKAGTGTLTTLLKKVSPELLRQLQGTTDVSSALDLYLRAVEQVTDVQKRGALAAAAFGKKNGLALMLMLDKGVSGVKALKDEADRLGITLSTDMGRNAEDYVDAMTNMDAAMQGLKRTIGGDLMKELQPLIEQLTEWVVLNRGEISTKIADGIAGLKESLQGVDWKAVGEDIKSVAQALVAAGKGAAALVKAAKWLYEHGTWGTGGKVGSMKSDDVQTFVKSVTKPRAMASPLEVVRNRDAATNRRKEALRAETETASERKRRVLGGMVKPGTPAAPAPAPASTVDVNVTVTGEGGAQVTKTTTKAKGNGIGRVTGPTGSRGM